MDAFQKPDASIFASAFDEIPQALSLFIKGRNVRSNAALQYMAKTGCSLQDAVSMMCALGNRAAWSEKWTGGDDGMIQSRIRTDWILHEAQRYDRPSQEAEFINHEETFFEEKSILLRLALAKEDLDEIPEESLELFCLALQCNKEKDACRIVRLLGAELDKRQMEGKGTDPVLLSAAGILEQSFFKIQK